ncbi:MAG: N-acetyl-gamma-glutamyl-phosphate reductase, partial [Ferruginibacter sp.]
MASKIKIGIIGGAGYTGGELTRILLNHPTAEIKFVHSKSNAGKPLYSVHADLIGETEMMFSSTFTTNDGERLEEAIDVLFLCVGHGDAKKFLTENNIHEKIKIIDLSQDFRLTQSQIIHGREFIYGLPELNKEKIQGANNI